MVLRSDWQFAHEKTGVWHKKKQILILLLWCLPYYWLTWKMLKRLSHISLDSIVFKQMILLILYICSLWVFNANWNTIEQYMDFKIKILIGQNGIWWFKNNRNYRSFLLAIHVKIFLTFISLTDFFLILSCWRTFFDHSMVVMII